MPLFAGEFPHVADRVVMIKNFQLVFEGSPANRDAAFNNQLRFNRGAQRFTLKVRHSQGATPVRCLRELRGVLRSLTAEWKADRPKDDASRSAFILLLRDQCESSWEAGSRRESMR
jgi:hypothetical protein